MARRSEIGTLAWAEESGGALRPGERLAAMAAALGAWWRDRVVRVGGADPGVSPAAIEAELRAPRSALIATAEELAARVSPPWLMNHCLRTYAWGALLGARDGVRFDRELLYLGCLLHDLGLTTAYATAEGQCFAAVGGAAARDALQQAGAAPEVAQRVAEAITLHLNVRVALAAHGAEAHLLHEGAAFDVIGARARHLAPSTRDTVVAHHPRLGFKACMSAAIEDQARRSPATRAGFLVRRVRFPAFIASAPFAE